MNYSTTVTEQDMRLTPAAAGKMVALIADADDDDISAIRGLCYRRRLWRHGLWHDLCSGSRRLRQYS